MLVTAAHHCLQARTFAGTLRSGHTARLLLAWEKNTDEIKGSQIPERRHEQDGGKELENSQKKRLSSPAGKKKA